MYYLEESCSVCGDGLLGFFRCSDGKKVVIMCDECNAVWMTAGEVKKQNPIYPESPSFLLPDSIISISGGDSGWATIEEIKLAGMEKCASEKRCYEP